MNKKAFTLVELIVVITILAILGTIAFISFQGYTKNSRDSVRKSDIASIMKALELYQLKTGKYPKPDDGTVVYYQTGSNEVWNQGTVGIETTKKLDTLDKVPRDPLTGTEYAYSVLNTKKEYQVAAALEGGAVASINIDNNKRPVFKETGLEGKITYLIPKANAAIGNVGATAYVKGTYNGQIAKVQSGTTTYVLAVPTIINGDMSLKDIIEVLNNKKLVYNGYSNLPASYSGTSFKIDGGFNYSQTGGIVVYSGSINDLKTDEDARISLTNNLKTVYESSILRNEGNYKQLIDTVIDTNTPSKEAKLIACGTIDNGLGTETINDGCGNSGEEGGGASTDWRALDPNCDIPDIDIYSGGIIIQTWAGCNSTLDIGLEYITETSCFNYNKDGVNPIDNLGVAGACGVGNLGDSNDNAKDYYDTLSGTINQYNDVEVNNIWGKLYPWYKSGEPDGVNLDNNNDGVIDDAEDDEVCPGGYHIPSDTEWKILEMALGCSSAQANLSGWRCPGQGYVRHSNTNSTTSVSGILKLPLTGIGNFSGNTSGRGNNGWIWSSNSYIARSFHWWYNRIERRGLNRGYAFAIRCIKD